MSVIRLPKADRSFELFQLSAPKDFPGRKQGNWNRIAFAAAHMVHDNLAPQDPWLDMAIDWEGTLAFRRHLWDLGFAVAEAMDTAQRGMGLDWANALELIRRSVAEAKGVPGAVVYSGAGTDHLSVGAGVTARAGHRCLRGAGEAVEGGRDALS